ncbi:hypothetical protein CC79DRAFT_1317165 [Sarocladium strictum]
MQQRLRPPNYEIRFNWIMFDVKVSYCNSLLSKPSLWLRIVPPLASVTSSALPLRRKVAVRFYEPVKLEETLVDACSRLPNFSGRVSAETETGLERGDERAFQSFLNKVAHVCDIQKGGDTVTAIGIVAEFGNVRYFIGSNARKASTHGTLEGFMRGLLAIPTIASPTIPVTETGQFLQMLKYIAAFNKPRISFYTRALQARRIECLRILAATEDQDLAGYGILQETLGNLQEFVTSAINADGEADEVDTSVALIHFLNRVFSQGAAADAICQLCDRSRHNPESVWLKLRHLIARLRAYHVSAQTIVACRSRWPELFEEFQITIVPSSKPDANPLLKKKLSLHDALGRLTSDTAKIEQLREDARWLERFDVAGIYKAACTKDTFTPLVHAEVLVYDKIRSYLAENPGIKYWQGWRYIGTSKPTCRLCRYFFNIVDDDVSVRETHNNLYAKWRLPDCFDSVAAKAREDMMNEIVKYIRRDAVRTIQDKLPRGARNDSSSYPTVVSLLQTQIGEHEGGAQGGINELDGAFNYMSIRSDAGGNAPELSLKSHQVVVLT